VSVQPRHKLCCFCHFTGCVGSVTLPGVLELSFYRVCWNCHYSPTSVGDGLASWPVTVGVVEVGVVSQPEADAERYRCACLHCTQGLAGRGDGYQCGLDWGRPGVV